MDPLDDAFRRGVEEGRRQATASIEGDLVRRGEALRAGLTQLDAWQARVLDRAEDALTRAALAVARRILREALDVEPGRVQVLAQAAIGVLRGATAIRVHVHPLDVDAVRGDGALDTAVAYVADPGLARGDCRVESSFGEVDASLDAQLAEVARGLRGGGHAAPSPP
jgi:flagellar assembly protein FliH